MIKERQNDQSDPIRVSTVKQTEEIGVPQKRVVHKTPLQTSPTLPTPSSHPPTLPGFALIPHKYKPQPSTNLSILQQGPAL